MQEQLLRIKRIIVQLIARLEVPVDPVKPIVEAVLLSSLQGPRGFECAAVEQRRKLHLRLAVAVTRKAHPEVEVDIEGALFYIDPIQADDVDPSVNHALNPIVPVAKGGHMALLLFRGEIYCVGTIDMDQLKRGGDEPPMMEIAKANRARNLAVGVKVQPARQTCDG